MAAVADIRATEFKVTAMQPVYKTAFNIPVKDYTLLSIFSVFYFFALGIPSRVLLLDGWG